MTTSTASRKPSRKTAARASAPVAGDHAVPARTRNDAAPVDARIAAEDSDSLRGLFRDMLFVRRFEERTAQSYQQAKIGGYCHLNLGEEATVVGLGAAMRPTDYLFTNYREHGYALAKGIEPGRVMAELYGRATGTSKGWGGSMHMYDTATRMLGGYAIVGGQVPLAVGAALAIDYRGEDDVVVCQMGEGTTNIGAFHEALNIAALWDLPVVFLVINNQTGMGTTVERSCAEPDLWKRAAAYRMRGERVDGTDVLAVRDVAGELIETARREKKPALLEAVSHRLKGHSVVDPAKYRTEDAVAIARSNDPIVRWRDALLAAGVLDDRSVAELEADVTAAVAAAVEFADASPHPEPSSLFDYNYATPVAGDSRRLPADPLFTT
ncbi:pyruvate dehydrogenase (acetyl-transferring) E1 component subunit alpha [Nocardia implantans]|uniref:Pyruvate dehydrogenase E1 component subunit alpha n=1 Tax=Nocardia implantans TaxID=3108168 RepID=A0ABU6AX14_9NOCA|nr:MULTISPECIES: pyruvate dehydrogenase (acetyl-transferring) E1 component subunit alpha [unclassified Nocardia]MBF6193835.1 pyruvate dehydrogenase (acetyl-transferring) E1 component subunit alpha [Nocardia beijingensis]MEA3529429.1 pyruvate dehydrogenase (acetyl-transferring) E1 component subunit alpha [Nocardia sp. CDC192]MEB3512015.1 pyruvate dehydrogenase (acetyl-transferring) E1 component subunit alpha [Nocardia sp. CDC186]